MKLSFLIPLLCLFFIHAHSQDKPSILIGTGGGVTGMATVYHITPSGEVLKGKGISEIKYTECGKLKRAKAKEIIAKSAAVFTSATFDYPGNIYYFLTLKESDGEKKITWGDAEHKVPDNIKALYDEIQTLVTDLKYKPIPEPN